MKLIGELKKQVERTNTKEEAKDVIANAGMELTDDELDNVVGGAFSVGGNSNLRVPNKCHCDNPYVGRSGKDMNDHYYEKCGNCGGYITWQAEKP